METISTSATKLNKQFEKYMRAQCTEIDVDKWFEGIKCCKDPGQEYILDWITTKGESFRKKWDDSCCSQCGKWNRSIHHSRICCLQMLKECKGFEPEGD
jgi:hypothetical protein